MHATSTLVTWVGWFSSPWAQLQLLALLAGALTLWWRDGRRWLPAYAVGAAGAALGATLLGTALKLPAALAAGQLPVMSFSSFGALGGLALTFAWMTSRGRGDVRDALDRIAAPAAIATAVARVGCFVAGCDFGTISSSPWAIETEPGSPAFMHHLEQGLLTVTSPSSMPIHPVQLYEVLVGLSAAVIALICRRRVSRGRAFLWATLSYGIGRACIEWFRADVGLGTLGPFNTAQWLAFGLVAWAVSRLAAHPTSRHREPRTAQT